MYSSCHAITNKATVPVAFIFSVPLDTPVQICYNNTIPPKKGGKIMNIDYNLMLVKGEDKTASVVSWRFHPYKPIVFITYSNHREYPYRTDLVEFHKNPRIVYLEDRIALKDESPLSGAVQLQYFGRHCRIVYKTGYRELVSASRVRIIVSAFHSPECRNCFEYLKQIAIVTGLVVEKRNILAASYEKIDFVREDSVLAAFLSGKYENDPGEKNTSIVYPFGFNLSQKQAVDNALCNQISIIEGPPGTGKTQTILNIIANAVMRGESVAVVSSNNSATANVLEKLKKYGVGFIAAPLGNVANREVFIESQDPNLPDMTDWREPMEDLSVMRRDEAELDGMLKLQNELSASLPSRTRWKRSMLISVTTIRPWSFPCICPRSPEGSRLKRFFPSWLNMKCFCRAAKSRVLSKSYL